MVQSEEDKAKAKAIADSSVKSFGSPDHSSRIQEKGEALGRRAQTLYYGVVKMVLFARRQDDDKDRCGSQSP